MARFKAINIFKYINISKRSALPPPVPRAVWHDPFYFVAFGFGSGAFPFAPGTVGTVFALPFYFLLSALPFPAYVLFVLAFIVFSVWLCGRISHDIHVHDHPGMCIDEFAGYFVAMLHAPSTWGWAIIGFLLFRLFDIWKPGPIRYVDEHVSGGLGMVLDDVIAGAFSMAIIQLMLFLLGR